MKISVFGLGYVGCVSAAGFAARGHTVVGVDVNPLKVRLIEDGQTPVLEAGLAESVAASVAQGRLTATTDGLAAATSTDFSLVCVGTPSTSSGGLSTEALERVANVIGRAMADIDFGVAVNPEFLREGTSLEDFENPPKTVIGAIDARSADDVAALYEGMPGPVHRVALRVAEMTKYADNAFHALKVGFANEIGAACRAFGLDSHEVMRIFRSDTKLNISPAYLTPGFAFGGSCLPKDLRALLYAARHADLELPILQSVLPSNERHL